MRHSFRKQWLMSLGPRIETGSMPRTLNAAIAQLRKTRSSRGAPLGEADLQGKALAGGGIKSDGSSRTPKQPREHTSK